jgi:Leishmanolysin/Bacterial Ig-like domain (group 1)
VRSNLFARRACAALMTCALAACGDPSDPEPRVPTTIQVSAGDAQSATAGVAVTTAPVVVVRDQDGQPLPNITVRFTVVEGGGSLLQTSAVTDAQGQANPGGWTLGPTPGLNAIEATVDGLAAIRITATGESPYNIKVTYIGTATAAQQAAVTFAINRWRSAIVQDLVNIPMQADAGECFDSQPAINENVDDLLIFIEFKAIDGQGDVLGQSGPCYIRTIGRLPVVGLLQLDNADLAFVQTQGLLNALITHEIGHVIGFGTLWTEESKNLLTGSGTDPRYTGTAGIQAYQAAGGSAATVPVEDTGGSGTIDSHWRESVFGNELMTGLLNPGANPFSAISMRSMQDLGYSTTAAAADPFTLAAGVAAQAVAGPTLDLDGRERMIRPTHSVGPDGQRTRLR